MTQVTTAQIVKAITNPRIINSKKCGPFEVVAKDTGMWTVQFVNTGTIRTVVGTYASAGNVVDPYARTVADIGYIGEGPYGSRMVNQMGAKVKSPVYQLWSNMLYRCYVDPKNGKRPTYATCTVHKDWHCFQTFCQDIKQLDGYGAWLAYQSGLSGGEKIELDKDVLCEGMDVKVYGPNTCLFLTKTDNLKAMWAARRVQA